MADSLIFAEVGKRLFQRVGMRRIDFVDRPQILSADLVYDVRTIGVIPVLLVLEEAELPGLAELHKG